MTLAVGKETEPELAGRVVVRPDRESEWNTSKYEKCYQLVYSLNLTWSWLASL